MGHYTNGPFGSPKGSQCAKKLMVQGWFDIPQEPNCTDKCEFRQSVCLFTRAKMLLGIKSHPEVSKTKLELGEISASPSQTSMCPRDGAIRTPSEIKIHTNKVCQFILC